ncbi:MAG: hypothetical protein JXQ73_26855 [Phycisphaerae bacterium]|nr:hypothetical protein [Phycisphaerae bacterium]
MHKSMAVLMCVVIAVVAAPMIEGCCMPTSNLVAAATAGAKVFGAIQEYQDAQTPEEIAAAVLNIAQTVADLSTSEIASAVNIVTGASWTLDDAQQIKDLAAQVDEETVTALTETDFPDISSDTDPSELIPLVEAAGITVTEHQVELITGVLEGLQDGDLGGLAGLVPGLEL